MNWKRLCRDYRRQVASWIRQHPPCERRKALELAREQMPFIFDVRSVAA